MFALRRRKRKPGTLGAASPAERANMIIITERETSRNSERHFCRNLRCRTKLSVPVENHHHAFCASSCFDHFYRSRCLVCEKDITVDPMTGQRRRRSGHRKFCGRKCKAEAAKFPHAFRLPTKLSATSKSADKSRAKTRLEDDRAPFRSLAHWWWGGDPDNGDHSLYDDDGLTIARIVSEGDRYCLRTPVTGPRVSSPDLEQAKRRAENLALSNLPLVGGVNIEAAEVARINAANTKPHPMGPPLNRPRPVNTGDAVLLGEITEAKVPGDPGPIPEFLRRVQP
jgi:hypothetical protein